MVKYAPGDAPFIGAGRWTWPLYLLEKEDLMKKVDQRGLKLEADMENLRSEGINRAVSNPQTLWETFKHDITKLAKTAAKESYHKLNSRIKAIENDHQLLLADPEYDADESLHTNAAFLANELAHLEKIKVKNQCAKLRAKLADQCERLGGCWSAISKDKKPRDLILRLKVPGSNPVQYERCTKRLTNLARDFHENLQNEDVLPVQDQAERVHTIDKVLEAIPASQLLPEPENTTMSWEVSEFHTQAALKLAKESTAAGLDGCPNELWKKLQQRHEVARQANQISFNVVNTLSLLYQDIQRHGIDTRTNFAEGWMCPLFKKKDPTDIRNYRPITVLNTDYKLLTKVLALQLMEHADTLIHEDQAGFVPKRSIFNHIRLAKAIISYAEIAEEDGAIIALDQEKAYDRIHHDYLWKVLEAFHIPAPFIKTVKALYSNAQTCVAINGVLSKPFKVTRGVRQGDPLSCALFDLAIEPLACLIRNNPNIRGLDISCLIEKLVIKLFADDTNLYLSKYDRLDVIQSILDLWCKASGAKFNIEKTEIIPISTATHRQTVSETRKINPLDESPLPDQIRIAKDKEAVRMLGAWIGNKANDLTPWEPIVDKIKANLRKWSRIRPSLDGKVQIIQAVVGGLTQFLTQTQGMPPRIEAALEKVISDFIWEDGRGPRIAMDLLRHPKELGGLNILDIKARNEAVDLMWLKTYLNFSPNRQPWAAVTDLLIDAAAPDNTIKEIRSNPFLQCWNPPMKGSRANKLNDDIRRMLKAARDHGTNLAVVKIPLHLRNELPAWYHLDDESTSITRRTTKCLIEKHKILSVIDLVNASARVRDPHRMIAHRPSSYCYCRDCSQDREKGCYTPHDCALEALSKLQKISPKLNPVGPENPQDLLSLTPTRKAYNQRADPSSDGILFDPSLTCGDRLADCFRIFTDPSLSLPSPALRLPPRGRTPSCQKVTLYTDGACMNNGKRNAMCSGGVWAGHGNPLNTAIRVPGHAQSNQVGEIAAIIVAASLVPLSQPLEIISDSKYAIEGLTKHLQSWENQGWIGVKNAPFFKRAAYLLRRRTAPTIFKWVKGHDGIEGNEQSDRLAREGASNPILHALDLHILNRFNVQGAKLVALTQAIAYKGIRERKPIPLRQSSSINTQLAREAIERYTGKDETDATIWLGIRKKPLRPKIRQFLFRAMHEVFMIGNYWSHIQAVEERRLCTTCGTTESMSHILTSCRSPPARIIWSLAKETWPHRDIPWPNQDLGTILGCGCLAVPQTANHSRTHLRGASCLLQILLSESAYLIWSLRCERVIGGRTHSPQEIKARWLRTINTRLTDDKITATKIKSNKGFTNLVVNTWEHILSRETDLPNDWINQCEVLVGSGARP